MNFISKKISDLLSPGRSFSPLRHKIFRSIWIAMLFSFFGQVIQNVGAAWQMTLLTKSHTLVALVQGSQLLPTMLLAIFTGAIADGYDKRKVMILGQTIMLISSTILAITAYMGVINPYILLLLTFCVGIGATINGPSWQASLRLQVPLEDLPQAVSLNSLSFNLARSAGPALGGLLISLSGPKINFALNALSFIGIIMVLLSWKPETIPQKREHIFDAIKRGLRFCINEERLRNPIVRAGIFGTVSAAFSSLLPLVARDILNGNQLTYGFLLGSFGLGSIFASLTIAKVRRHFSQDTIFTIATIIYAVGTLSAAWSEVTIFTMGAAFIAGSGWIFALNTANVTIQMNAPEDIVGRCLSIYHMCTFGGIALGAYIFGSIGDLIGLRATMSFAALILFASPLLRTIAPIFEQEK